MFFTTSNDGGVAYSLAWVFVNIPYQQYDANNNLSPLGCQKSDSCFLNVSDLNCPPTNETKPFTSRNTHREIQCENLLVGPKTPKGAEKGPEGSITRRDEQEYVPCLPPTKRVKKIPQNSNRNLVPNVIHQVISFLQKKKKSEEVLLKVISVLGVEESLSVTRFYSYHSLIKDKLNHYVNEQSLSILKELQEPACEMYSSEEQQLFNKASRIMVRYFLSHKYDEAILTSKRVNMKKKHDHLITKRRIAKTLASVFNSE